MQGTPLRALILFVLVLPAFAIDREAFTFTKYDLEARIERDQAAPCVRGRLTLRNDSDAPKIAVLQISSSLDWRSIELTTSNFSSSASPTRQTSTHRQSVRGGCHTSSRAETERVDRSCDRVRGDHWTGRHPTDEAGHARDQGQEFDGTKSARRLQACEAWVMWRGIRLRWMPRVFRRWQRVRSGARWKAREANANMKVVLHEQGDSSAAPPEILCNGTSGLTRESGSAPPSTVDCNYAPLGIYVPSFVVAEYSSLRQGPANFYFATT
jgi:hypothetical protein